MDVQKYITNSFFGLCTGILSYAANRLDKISDKVDSVDRLCYQLEAKNVIHEQVHDRMDFVIKDLQEQVHACRAKKHGHAG